MAAYDEVVDMIRFRSLRMFKREYFCELRKGKTSEDAADAAMSSVKTATIEMIEKEFTNSTQLEKDEMWGEVLSLLMEWQILLVNVPIDRARLGDVPKDITHNPDKVVDPDYQLIRDHDKDISTQGGSGCC